MFEGEGDSVRPRGRTRASAGSAKTWYARAGHHRMVGAIYLDKGASHYDLYDNRISRKYESYDWRVSCNQQEALLVAKRSPRIDATQKGWKGATLFRMSKCDARLQMAARGAARTGQHQTGSPTSQTKVGLRPLPPNHETYSATKSNRIRWSAGIGLARTNSRVLSSPGWTAGPPSAIRM